MPTKRKKSFFFSFSKRFDLLIVPYRRPLLYDADGVKIETNRYNLLI